MSTKSVAVLTGGTGPERSGSLVSGSAAASSLSRLGLSVSTVDIATPDLGNALDDADVAFVAGHGWYGEDGKLQGLLELSEIPYTGSGVLASAVAMHKPTANALFESVGLHVPAYHRVSEAVDACENAAKWAANIGYPLFAKPASGGGSLGATAVASESELRALLSVHSGATDQAELMLSQFVSGTELSVGIVSMWGQLQVLPILQTSHDREFYDYEVKHTPQLRRHTCPATLDETQRRLISKSALTAFSAVGCSGFGRVDFILDDAGIPWILEVNTVPGLSPQGNLATMANAADIGYDELIQSVLSTAFLKRRGYRP